MAKTKIERKRPGLNIYHQEVEEMTKEKLISLFPNKKRTITDETLELINSAIAQPTFDGYGFENTLVEYSKVMDRRSGSLHDYIRAVKFVAYLESGMTDIDAYRMAFADRELVRKSIGKAADTSEYVNVVTSAHRFKKTPMVVDIMTMADVAASILYKGTFHLAVGVLQDEMINASFSKDRIAAASVIIKEFKPVDTIQQEINFGLTDDAQKHVERTNNQMATIAENQLKLLEQGYNIADIQKLHIKKHEDIIDGEIDE